MPKGSVSSRPRDTEPRVRRGYFECRYGQLHVHNAIPPGGGFDEATALLCLHPAGKSGRAFLGVLPALGQDRSVYAPDLPGSGESDGPATRVSVVELSSAIGDFLDSMRFRQIDVMGYQTGSLLASELALARPQQVRKVVLVGVPLTTEGERLRQISQPVFIIRAKDELWDATPRAREYLPRARALDLPQLGPSMFETPADAAVGPIKEFLGT